MTGPEHYREGDRLLDEFKQAGIKAEASGPNVSRALLASPEIANTIALAQAHYTAALAAATVVVHQKLDREP